MKAVRYTKYGPADVLKIEEVEKPVPQDQQVLVKVHASSINAADYRGLGSPILARVAGGGLLRPKDPRFGRDLAGMVEAVGAAVTRFKPGDEVFGAAQGAFAEYVLARENNLALKPASITFEEAAAVPIAAITALQGFRWSGGIEPGQMVVIQGASGGVGMFAVQLARVYGAEVTAVVSPRNLELARSLGSDHVIDYTQEDFTRKESCYDLIFAVNGYHPIANYKRALKPKGVYVCAGGTMPQIIESMLMSRWMARGGGQKFGMMGIAKINHEDLAALAELLEGEKIKPFIDRSYPLEEVVAAIQYVDKQHAQGKVVITI